MAIFTDGQGRYFLDTFRTKNIIDDNIIGGLMEIKYNKISNFKFILKILPILSAILLISLIIFSTDGWSEKINKQSILCILSFLNFFSMILVFIFFTSAPKFVTVEKKILYMVKGSISNSIEFCITSASMSLFILFFCMSSFYTALSFSSYHLLVFVTALFFIYFVTNFYRFLLVSRG